MVDAGERPRPINTLQTPAPVFSLERWISVEERMKDGVRVLFICTHNSARSQMGEAFMNALGKGRFVAESAGFEPGPVNPVVIEVMKEIGYDLSKNRSKSVFELFKQGRLFDHVITVCDDGAEGECPYFRASPRGFIDPLPTLPGFKAVMKRCWNKPGKSGTKSRPRWKSGLKP